MFSSGIRFFLPSDSGDPILLSHLLFFASSRAICIVKRDRGAGRSGTLPSGPVHRGFVSWPLLWTSAPAAYLAGLLVSTLPSLPWANTFLKQPDKRRSEVDGTRIPSATADKTGRQSDALLPAIATYVRDSRPECVECRPQPYNACICQF